MNANHLPPYDHRHTALWRLTVRVRVNVRLRLAVGTAKENSEHVYTNATDNSHTWSVKALLGCTSVAVSATASLVSLSPSLCFTDLLALSPHEYSNTSSFAEKVHAESSLASGTEEKSCCSIATDEPCINLPVVNTRTWDSQSVDIPTEQHTGTETDRRWDSCGSLDVATIDVNQANALTLQVYKLSVQLVYKNSE